MQPAVNNKARGMDTVMELSYIFLLLAAIPVFFYLFSFQDADLTVLFYSKFGKSPSAVLKGKVVWISGASSGIGEYLAYELAKHGARLVLSARRKEKLLQVQGKCIAIGKKAESSYTEKDVLVLPMDTTKYDTHKDLTLQVLKHFKQIDILVNNAGRAQRSWADETPLEVDRAIFDLNVVGPISHTKAVLPHMLERGQGMILTVSSVFGKYAFPYETDYCASKYALHGYFDALRLELQEKNIKVMLALPGPVKSEVAKNSFTAQPGVSYGDLPGYSDNAKMRMDTERCVELMVVGLANELEEVWISAHPQLFFVYLSDHAPCILRWYQKRYFMDLMRKSFNISKGRE